MCSATPARLPATQWCQKGDLPSHSSQSSSKSSGDSAEAGRADGGFDDDDESMVVLFDVCLLFQKEKLARFRMFSLKSEQICGSC